MKLHYLLLLFLVTTAYSQIQEIIGDGLAGRDLLNYIVANYKTSTTLGYDTARDTLYGVIDLKTDNQLSCIYSGFTITLNPSVDPSTDAFNKGINCEHSWPQSMGADSEPQRSDMHHLYPAKDNINSSRGNDPYMEIPDANTDVWFRNDVSQTTIPTSNLEEWAEKENGVPTGFEPRHASKGDIARSSFYFIAMYQNVADTNFWKLEKDFLYQWHYADPVDQDEYDRTYRIAHYQNNMVNPFILDSTLARRIWFSGGFPPDTTSPDEPTILTAGDIVIVGVNCDDPDDFAFVPLVDLNAGTVINFTDNGWLSTNTFRSGEGVKTFRAPSAIPAGKVIVYTSNSIRFTSSGSFALSASGDQLIAYQGTATSPTILYAVNISGMGTWQADATSSNTSALPLGLTNGTNCVAVTEKDNILYDGLISSRKDRILMAVSNIDNWAGDDATRYDFTAMSDFMVVSNTAPSAPILLFPLNGSELIPDDSLIWHISDDIDLDPVTGYELQIDDNDDFSTPLIDLPNISQSNDSTVVIWIKDLENNSLLIDDMRYYWRVNATDDQGGVSLWSMAEFTYNSENDAPFPVVVGFTPADSMLISNLSPIISWLAATDPDISDSSSNLTYRFQLSDSPEFVNVLFESVTDTGITQVVLENLDDEQIYFYRVQTIDDEGAVSAWSEVQAFIINVQLDPPVDFVLLAPPDRSSTASDEITFIWAKSSDSDIGDYVNYALYLSQDNLFNIFERIEVDTDTTVMINNLEDGTYYWKVLAYDTDSLLTWGSNSDEEPWEIQVSTTNLSGTRTLPQKYCLYANCPNPFNPTTTIQYDIPKASQVTLTIINMNGQVVERLVNQKQEPGFYSVQWDARNVSTGVYFYQIQADGFQQVKKMLLIK